MIDQPIYRRILAAVGKADSDLAVSLVLHELADIFEMFAEEVDNLYLDDPYHNDLSKGYMYASSWCNSWALEVDYVGARRATTDD